jgi:hypothetical protein
MSFGEQLVAPHFASLSLFVLSLSHTLSHCLIA